MAEKESKIFQFGNTAYLSSTSTVVTMSETKNIFAVTDADPIEIPGITDGKGKKYRPAIPWGEDNDIPNIITTQSYKVPVLTSGMLFNICMGYGQGPIPVRYDEKGEPQKVTDNAEINAFWEENDVPGFFLEQVTDMMFFFNVMPEIILNNEKRPKIVEINHKEAQFSRWEEMNKKGVIEHHFYSALWADEDSGETLDQDTCFVTPVLERRRPLKDLKIRTGISSGDDGKKKDSKERKFIIPVTFPTPGKFYYQKPYWYSIIESGWLDFAIQIPEFKKALMQNQMTIKYHIELSPEYFEIIYKNEGLKTDAEKKARIKKEYENFNKFLSDTKNTGKSVVSYLSRHTAKGGGTELQQNIKITPIENDFKGGEYITDSEEVSNIISYALNVHASVIGSSPGKNKPINGTEARELFLIKQALMKPFRDRLLMPFYLIKRYNEWPEDIEFIIPDINLVTLDQDKSGKKETNPEPIANNN